MRWDGRLNNKQIRLKLRSAKIKGCTLITKYKRTALSRKERGIPVIFSCQY
jgi:hypothetical protein